MNDFVALNVYSFLVLLVIHITLKEVLQKPKVDQERIIKYFAFVLLAINIVKLIIVDYFIPVEFSTVSYYVVPTIILLRLKRLDVWAGYAGIMAGFFYYLTMLLQGGSIYSLYDPLNIYTSLLCHGILLFIGIYKLKTANFQKEDKGKLIVGIILMVSWALIMRSHLVLEERLFIYELLDGLLIRNITNVNITAMLGIYYITVITLVYQTTKWYIQLNHKLNPDVETKHSSSIQNKLGIVMRKVAYRTMK